MHALGILSLFTALPLSILAVPHTVDDSNPGWRYSGGVWHAIDPGSPCAECSLQPDRTPALNSTWHDTTDDSAAELEFTGISMEVYVIYVGNWPRAFNASITIDNEMYSTIDILLYSPDNVLPSATPGFRYNHLVFARKSLPLTSHLLTIRNVDPSPLLLDYVIYDDGVAEPLPTVTFTQTPLRETLTSTSTMTAIPFQVLLPVTRAHIQSKRAVIAGGVTIGLSLLGHVVLFFLYRRCNPPSR
jgi:hypothetical protein